MSPTERERQMLFARASAVLGEEAAEVMMNYLPSHPVPELLTVSRFESEMIALRGEIAELRGEFAGEIAEVRGEIAELRGEFIGEMAELRGGFIGEIAEVRGEMTDLRVELKGEMTDLRVELKGEMADLRVEIARLYRWGAAVVAANAVAVVSAMVF